MPCGASIALMSLKKNKHKKTGWRSERLPHQLYLLTLNCSTSTAQHSLNSEEKFKTVSKEFMSTHVYKYTLRNEME